MGGSGTDTSEFLAYHSHWRGIDHHQVTNGCILLINPVMKYFQVLECIFNYTGVVYTCFNYCTHLDDGV